MFYKVDAGDKRDVVGVEAEDGQALDDGPQLLHPLPVDQKLIYIGINLAINLNPCPPGLSILKINT